MQVQGIQLRYMGGADASNGGEVSTAAATSTADALQALLSAGATLVGRAASDELQLGYVRLLGVQTAGGLSN